ncbi:hypothetical protein BZL29_3571 [Mycobacterium kansasii]|uniref:Uncharacterized protein n=1 Tax=Mycobacterium kansasii TaxID=1768 RepID=A0A1V3XF76_MYCKA|nr:hypothetical protein BZL29_3571 [Mycobacterium kansasii]
MSNDVDPQSPGREPDPFRGVNSGGSPGSFGVPMTLSPAGQLRNRVASKTPT